MPGIYLHIPYCKQRCTYCDFHFSTTFSTYREKMNDSILKEIDVRNSYLSDKNLKSIYFGGGTPSILLKSELEAIFSKMKKYFQYDSQAEITLEANPDDITKENLQLWKSVGINRLSIGLQSFKESDLKWMNRAHDVNQALNCVELAQKEGFNNVSVDLIYGLPDLTLEEWEKHIDLVLQMGVQHISAYCLTIEKKTALHSLVAMNKIVPAGEDEQSDQFLILSDKLTKAGFLHYEISNFGLPGFEAVHNSNYWKGEEYLGLGPSAHSFNTKSRQWNVANNQQYMSKIEKQDSWFEIEMLSEKDRWNELVLTGLRTSYGLSLKKLKEIQLPTEDFNKQVANFEKKNWLSINEDKIILTKEGRLKADYVASELFL